MSYNLKAIVRYDGTGFAGWQVQPGRRTVQGELERVLAKMSSQHVAVRGAGRTDSGVHALGQVCNFRWPQPDGDRLRRSLSGMLGPEVRVESVEVVADDFDSRYSAKSKCYAYSFSLSTFADPFCARYAWNLPWRVDLDLLSSLAGRIEGRHDFAGFQCSGAATKTTVRTIHSVRLIEGGVVGSIDARGLWRIEFTGEGFLYKMVRNLSATLIDIARGHLPEETLDQRLESAGPFRGQTAPAHGLTLVSVGY